MTEDNDKAEMGKGVVEVGGEEKEAQKEQDEMTVKQKAAEKEMIVKQKAAEEEQKKEEDEKKEASVENEPNETSTTKSNHGELEDVKEQDISQYLWNTLLKYINKGNQKVYTWLMDGVDSGLSKNERGPVKPGANKEEKLKHTKERGKELYDERDTVAGEYAKSITDKYLASESNVRQSQDRDSLKNIIVHASKIAYDEAASEFLHEKMSKDKNFDFASMSKEDIIKEVKGRIKEKQERLMSGVVATSLFAETIEGKSPKEALNACEEYLNIRENEVNEIKKLVTNDLEAGNFASNDRKPSRDIGVKINAYNQSFNNDAVAVNSVIKEAVAFLEKSNLTASDEKITLQEFQEKINQSQKLENAVQNLKDLSNITEKYNSTVARRNKIKEFRADLNLGAVKARVSQQNPSNAIIQAVSRKSGGRNKP